MLHLHRVSLVLYYRVGKLAIVCPRARNSESAGEIPTLASQRGALDPHVLTSPLVALGYTPMLVVLLKDAMQSYY